MKEQTENDVLGIQPFTRVACYKKLASVRVRPRIRLLIYFINYSDIAKYENGKRGKDKRRVGGRRG